MVTRARFERATPSFGGWCSIQLSYRATQPDDNGFAPSLEQAHSPRDALDLNPQSIAIRRLAYDELLASQLALALMRNRMKKTSGRTFRASGALRDDLETGLSGVRSIRR